METELGRRLLKLRLLIQLRLESGTVMDEQLLSYSDSSLVVMAAIVVKKQRERECVCSVCFIGLFITRGL